MRPLRAPQLVSRKRTNSQTESTPQPLQVDGANKEFAKPHHMQGCESDLTSVRLFRVKPLRIMPVGLSSCASLPSRFSTTASSQVRGKHRTAILVFFCLQAYLLSANSTLGVLQAKHKDTEARQGMYASSLIAHRQSRARIRTGLSVLPFSFSRHIETWLSNKHKHCMTCCSQKSYRALENDSLIR